MHRKHCCVMPPIIHPTKTCVRDHWQCTVVPHVHPTHTINRFHNIIENVHSYPYSESSCYDTRVRNVQLPPYVVNPYY